MRRALPILGLLLLTAGTATGCANGNSGGGATGLPRCAPAAASVGGGIVLMAQAVPAAQWVPCVREVPVGWSFDGLSARDGEASMQFGSDREGPHALTVLLRPSCDLAGALEVPSERPEMRRYERITRVSTGFGGERHYTFPGGCVTYRFDLRGNTRAEGVATVSEALSFLSRESVARQVREASDNQLELDPPGSDSR